MKKKGSKKSSRAAGQLDGGSRGALWQGFLQVGSSSPGWQSTVAGSPAVAADAAWAKITEQQRHGCGQAWLHDFLAAAVAALALQASQSPTHAPTGSGIAAGAQPYPAPAAPGANPDNAAGLPLPDEDTLLLFASTFPAVAAGAQGGLLGLGSPLQSALSLLQDPAGGRCNRCCHRSPCRGSGISQEPLANNGF